MKTIKYSICALLAWVVNIPALAVDLNLTVPRPPINVSNEILPTSASAGLSVSSQSNDPLSRNMKQLMNDACVSCAAPEKKKEMVLEVNSQGLRDLLPFAVKGPSLRWQGDKGFTEHNLRMRVSRSRVNLNWESRFK